MSKVYVSATELKNKVADILNDVYFGGNVAVVERYGKPIAEIVPIKDEKMRGEDIKKALDATFGILPDFPDVTKFRVSRKKSLTL